MRKVQTCASAIDSQPPHLTHYILVRNDLPLGLLAAQVCHAAGESVADGTPPPPGTHAVVLGLSPRQLADALTALQLAGVPHVAIIENQAPYAAQLTAVGLRPTQKEVVYKHLKNYKLLK